MMHQLAFQTLFIASGSRLTVSFAILPVKKARRGPWFLIFAVSLQAKEKSLVSPSTN